MQNLRSLLIRVAVFCQQKIFLEHQVSRGVSTVEKKYITLFVFYIMMNEDMC